MNRPTLLAMTLFALSTSACAARPPVAPPEGGLGTFLKKPEKGPERPAAVAEVEAPRPMPPPAPIYYGFDSSLLSEEARGELQRLADRLRAEPGAEVTIEGHADDRGTEEYNLALGDRRAHAAKSYLSGLGISRERIRVVSFGEERPAARGDGESAWAKNRRSEFELRTRVASAE